MHPAIRNVTKLDAAKEQLAEAITLFFEDRSAIAIHTLVLAAHQVLHDCADRKASMIKSERAMNEGGTALIHRYNKEFNFFKHAQGDKDASIRFDPELHTFFLADSLHMYAHATGFWPHPHQVFNFWFILRNPNMVEAAQAKAAVSQARLQGWSADNKPLFLRMLHQPHLFGFATQSPTGDA